MSEEKKDAPKAPEVQPQVVALQAPLFNKVLAFIQDQPYRLVAGLLQELQQGVQVLQTSPAGDGSKKVTKKKASKKK